MVRVACEAAHVGIPWARRLRLGLGVAAAVSSGVVAAASCTPDSPAGEPPGASSAPAPDMALATPRAAYIEAVQARAPAAYSAARTADGVRVDNPAQGFAARLTGAGVRLAPRRDAGWSWSMAASRWGCAGQLAPVAAAEPEARGHRIEYRRAGLTEWYVNGPLGLEQGFTLPARPCADEGAEVVIELSLGDGLEATLVEGGAAVSLRAPSGREVLRYTDLHGVDAAGRALPARLEVEERRLAIRVDAAGAVYPVVIDPLVWADQGVLVASEPAKAPVGGSVAVWQDTAVVGVNERGKHGGASGSAHVFVRAGSAWSEQQRLLPAAGASPADEFGAAVAISGDKLVVGAPGDGERGAASGAAYVFTRAGSAWSQPKKLLPDGESAGDRFGSSVAISGNTIVVGAPGDGDRGAGSGAAHVFVRADSAWSRQQKLLPADGAAGDHFGHSLAVAEDTVVVGAPGDVVRGVVSGSAHVFARADSAWSQRQKLLPLRPATGDRFGSSVAVAEDTIVVGARGEDDERNGADSGAAYVFARAGSSWSEPQRLVLADGLSSDFFGSSVATAGDAIAVGAYFKDDNGAESGFARVFARAGAAWYEQQELLPPDGSDGRLLGDAVAISGDTIVVRSEDGDGEGFARVFTLERAGGDRCERDDQCITGHCVRGLCCDTACDDGCGVCAARFGATADGVCTQPTCAPYACGKGGDGCLKSCSSDAECAEGSYCAADHTCAPKGRRGEACEPGADCLESGCAVCEPGLFCVDGVCCNEACDGQCEACDGAARGTCSPVTGEPRGGRPRCPAGEDPCDQPQCDGSDPDTCAAYPASGTMCGTACDGARFSVMECDGEHRCAAAFEAPCGGFVCEDARTCKASCAGKDDCAKGYACSGGACVPSVACATVDDCAAPAVCDATTRTCVLPGSWTTEPADCGCATPGSGQLPRSGWLVALAAAGAMARRRSRPRGGPSGRGRR
ncbi:hypothetical protein WME99_27235 [Sorangium sp. So ce136]|uniref:hypothetical protein n=1 Tax=Sorangium sp. So ce136 TaxID=3133284 RepID=UPI003F06AE0C